MYTPLEANGVLDMTSPASMQEWGLSASVTNFLWAVMGLHILSFLILLALCFTAPEPNRVFHYTYTFGLLVACTSSFAQASDLGLITTVDQPASLPAYIYQTITFSAHALALGVLSGISWVTICLNVVTAVFWVATYFAGALTRSNHKWGFFALGTLAFVILAMSTLNECREEAERRGIGRDYIFLAGWVNFLWIIYIVAWALCDGSHLLGPTASTIWVRLLDLLVLEGTAFGFAVLARNWHFEKLGLAFSDVRIGRGQVGGVDMGERDE